MYNQRSNFNNKINQDYSYQQQQQRQSYNYFNNQSSAYNESSYREFDNYRNYSDHHQNFVPSSQQQRQFPQSSRDSNYPRSQSSNPRYSQNNSNDDFNNINSQMAYYQIPQNDIQQQQKQFVIPSNDFLKTRERIFDTSNNQSSRGGDMSNQHENKSRNNRRGKFNSQSNKQSSQPYHPVKEKPKPNNIQNKNKKQQQDHVSNRIVPSNSGEVVLNYRELIGDSRDYTFADIFDRKYSDGDDKYDCKLCKVTNINANMIKNHTEQQKHKAQIKMLNDSIKGWNETERRNHAHALITNHSYNHTSQFFTTIAKIDKALVGLTYIIEVLDNEMKGPYYFCVLCNKQLCDVKAIQMHITSATTHRLIYLARNFPSVLTLLQLYERFNNCSEFRYATMEKVCIEIEKCFGRGQAFIYEGSEFKTNKEALTAQVEARNHFSEAQLDNAQILLLKNVDLRDEPKQPKLEDFEEGRPKRVRRVHQGSLNAYRNRVEQAIKQLEKQLEEYERDPESHPFYKKEWQLFWNRKAEELTKRGEDPEQHDFKDEWCDFFLDRMKDLHRLEIDFRIDQIRKEMCLSKEDVADIEVPPTKMAKLEEEGSFNNGRLRNYSDNAIDRISQISKNPPTNKPSTSAASSAEPPKVEITNLTILHQMPPKITLVQCLRILSTLETELGLLAHKVLELLSKALKADRQKAKSSDELLIEDEHLNLMDMVKEKLIGLQIAKLVPPTKTQAVTYAIRDIKSLIDHYDKVLKITKFLHDKGKMDATEKELSMLILMFKSKESSPSEDQGQKLSKKARKAINKMRKNYF